MILRILLPVFLFSLVCSSQAAEEILIVYRKDVALYQKIAQTIEGEFGDRIHLLALDSRNKGNQSRLGGITPSLVIALGDLASYNCQALSSRKILLLISNPLIIQEAQKNRDCEVRLFTPPSLVLEKVHQIFPRFKRIGLIYTSRSQIYYKEAERAAQTLGIELISRRAGPEEIIRAVSEVIKECEAFLLLPDPLLLRRAVFENIIRQGFIYKKPIIGPSRSTVRLGALLSVDYDFEFLLSQCRKVLKDYFRTGRLVCPEIPYKVHINEKTLKFMGLKTKVFPEPEIISK